MPKNPIPIETFPRERPGSFKHVPFLPFPPHGPNLVGPGPVQVVQVVLELNVRLSAPLVFQSKTCLLARAGDRFMEEPFLLPFRLSLTDEMVLFAAHSDSPRA